jgi:hypothetical protein
MILNWHFAGKLLGRQAHPKQIAAKFNLIWLSILVSWQQLQAKPCGGEISC